MKIELIQPILHSGIEYGRGLHDVPDELAMLWFKDAPHAIRNPRRHEVVVPQGTTVPQGTVTKSVDADSADVERLHRKEAAGL